MAGCQLQLAGGSGTRKALAEDVEDLSADGILVLERRFGVTAGQMPGAGGGDVSGVVAVPLGPDVVTAVGFYDEVGGGPEEVDLVAEKRDVGGGEGEGVGAADLEDQALETGAGLGEGEGFLGK